MRAEKKKDKKNTPAQASSGRKWIFRIGALVLVVILSVVMFIVGRGHTVYFDNASIDYDGKTISAPYKIEVNVGGEQVAKLYEKERGMVSTMGQKFTMDLEITDQKGGASRNETISLNLPYNIDGIVLNLPAVLAAAPEDVYLSEFVSLATETDTGDDEEVIIDEFELPMEGEE